MKKSAMLWAVALVGAVLVVAVVVAVSAYDGRRNIDVQEMAAEGSMFRPEMPGARDASESLCDNGRVCVDAVDSETMTVLKYRSQQEAARAVDDYRGDARQSGWIAVLFKEPGLSDVKRDGFMRGLDGVNTSSAD